MTKHFVVVCYDIADDKRRTRLFKRLHQFGSPVQYSVFECLVDDALLVKLKQTVRRTIKPNLDHVRFYHLCAACQRRVETTRAGVEAAHDAPAFVV
jgi:CRISPR-associated protein Cas2